MNQNLHRAIAHLFRPNHEHIKALTPGELYDDDEGKDEKGEVKERVFVIVTNSESGREEGGVVVLEVDENEKFVISKRIPILEDFSIQVSIVPPSSTEPDYLASNSDMIVKLEGSGTKLKFLSGPVLRDFLDESKRLKQIADKQRFSETGSHAWMRWYEPTFASFSLAQKPITHYTRTPHPEPTLSNAFAGDPGDEDTDISVMQETWIREQLGSRVSEYATSYPISLRVGTFNVNGKPPSGSLRSWVGNLSRDEGDQPLPDVLVFGFQELDLSTEALIYSTTTAKEEAWCDAIVESMADQASNYVKLVSKQLVGMLILVFVRKTLRHHISSISSVSSGQGMMWMGNKGGVAIRFQIYDTVLCFVNSHLAAFDNMVERRNADYNELKRRLLFPLATRGETAQTTQATVFDADYTIWMGDQNYRVDLPDADVRELLRSANEQGSDDYSEIMPFDQLVHHKQLGRCFTEFAEPTIKFPPTYRFIVGNSDGVTYDTKRRPAWTDRILARRSTKQDLVQSTYESYPQIELSDHKPVASNFSLTLLQLDLNKVATILDSLKTRLGDTFVASEEILQDIAVEPKGVELGPVSYQSPVNGEFKIINQGTVGCSFRFIPSTPSGAISAQWITVTPSSGVILPGEERTITLKILVGDPVVRLLNEGTSTLEEVLVLHIGRSKDYFIPVSGNFQKTCFGNDLEWLARLHDGIRKTEVESPKKKNVGAPRELMKLMNWLMGHATNEGHLFLSPAPVEAVRSIREILDNGEEIPEDVNAIAVGDVLLQFLQSLNEPVIPWRFHAQCAMAQTLEEAASVLKEIPTVSESVWLSLSAFLQFICSVANQDAGSKARLLAAKFAPVLLRDDPTADSSVWLSPISKRQFLLFFLDTGLSTPQPENLNNI